MPTPPKDDQQLFARWEAEISYAKKDEAYRKWLDQCEKIIKRYRDQRKEATAEWGRRRYNVLWSNVETLKGAVYGRMPKPVAERRWLDRDPAARLASMMLERTLGFQMDIGGFDGASKRAVKDRLLPGMGVMWQRYVPEFESAEITQENEAEGSYSEDAEEAIDDGSGTVIDKLTYERIAFDYVYYRDFLWSPSRTWAEVPWVARRHWFDKSEAEEEFGEDIADQMTFGDPKTPPRDQTDSKEQMTLGKSRKAEVWEIWSKPDRKICYISSMSPGVVLKEESDDPLKLSGFFPCQEPLFSTQTNDTLVPVPDYIEYQDQAGELDTLTDRISKITTAIRANGVYDSSVPALQRLLQDGTDNKLIPVDQWAAFAEKGGVAGAIQLVPMDMLVEVLTELYNARTQVKQDLYEITGMSDIVRGVTDPDETMGAQKIKANFATGRLGQRQQEVALFAKGAVCIAAEIICEIFSDDSLKQMSGLDQMNKDAIQKAIDAVQPPPKPQPPQQQSGQPPANPMLMQQQMQQWQQTWDKAKQQAAMQLQQQQDQQFQQALAILRSDKLRGFRVDIETDSTIADDLQNDKGAAVEFMNGLFQSLEGAEQTLSAAPELVKPLGETIMWAARKYRVGRTLEAAWEDALDQLEDRIEAQKGQPPAPDPAQIKAQADVQVAQANIQATQARSQAETAKAQSDLQVQQIKLQADQAQAATQTKLDAAQLQVDQLKAAATNNTQLKLKYLDILGEIIAAQAKAGMASDADAVNAQLERWLSMAGMQHEATQNAMDRQHEVNMAGINAANTQAQMAAQPQQTNGAANA